MAIVVAADVELNVDSSVVGNNQGSSVLVFAGSTGRGLHSSTPQLNLSRFVKE